MHGFKKLLNNINFREYIERFDIIYLSETHIEGDQSITWLNQQYDTIYISASRVNTKGRPSGGEIIAKKRELTNITFERKGTIPQISIKQGNENIVLLPIYLNYNKWTADYERLQETLIKDTTANLMIIGDLNARTGSQQTNIPPEIVKAAWKTRDSKDNQENANGTKLMELINDHGMYVLNGCTKSDEIGEYTFLTKKGQSVIDYCIIGGTWLHRKIDIKVGGEEYSDHMPLEITTELELNRRNICEQRSIYRPNNIEYIHAIERLLAQKETADTTEEAIDNLQKVIKLACPPIKRKPIKQNPWFTYECNKQRGRTRRLLKKFKKSNTSEDRMNYAIQQKKYQETCREAREHYSNTIEMKFKSCNNSKQLWMALKEYAGYHSPNIIEAPVNQIADHLGKEMRSEMEDRPTPPETTRTEVEELDRDLSEEEIRQAMRDMKLNKAPGPDGITNECLRVETPNLVETIHGLFSKIWKEERVPNAFREAVTYPIFKKGIRTSPANYRGISLLNSIGKLFMSIIRRRLEKFVTQKGLLKENQAGFRSGYSTIDQIFALRGAVDLYKKRGMKLYVAFVDFSAAFDTLNREKLLLKLTDKGISSRLINVLRSYYNGTNARVWNGNEFSKTYETNKGVRQGCIVSPMLYNLYTDDIEETLGGGITIGGTNIRTLAYADDVAILAETPERLQMMINRLREYCEMNQMKINAEKTKVVIFNGKGRRKNTEIFWIDTGEEKKKKLEITSSFKYLGFYLEASNGTNRQIKGKTSDAAAAIGFTWARIFGNKSIPTTRKWNIFKAVAESILNYGVEIWGGRAGEDAEKLQNNFVRRTYGLPRGTPNYILTTELGVQPARINQLKRHLLYLQKVWKMDKRRITYIVMKECLEKRTGPFEDLRKTMNELGMSNYELPTTTRELTAVIPVILRRKREMLRVDHIRRARESDSRMLYATLKYTEGADYEGMSTKDIGTIIEVRAEMLKHDYMPYRTNEPCTFCEDRRGDTVHWLGKCPRWRLERGRAFGKIVMDLEDIRRTLNSRDEFKRLIVFRELWERHMSQPN